MEGDPAVRSMVIPVAEIMVVGPVCCHPMWQRAAARALIGPWGCLLKGGSMFLAIHHMPTSSLGVRASPGTKSVGIRAEIQTCLATLRIGAEMHLKSGWGEGDTVRRHMCLGTPMGRLAKVAAALEVR